jgi:hypothetical protein
VILKSTDVATCGLLEISVDVKEGTCCLLLQDEDKTYKPEEIVCSVTPQNIVLFNIKPRSNAYEITPTLMLVSRFIETFLIVYSITRIFHLGT